MRFFDFNRHTYTSTYLYSFFERVRLSRTLQIRNVCTKNVQNCHISISFRSTVGYSSTSCSTRTLPLSSCQHDAPSITHRAVGAQPKCLTLGHILSTNVCPQSFGRTKLTSIITTRRRVLSPTPTQTRSRDQYRCPRMRQVHCSFRRRRRRIPRRTVCRSLVDGLIVSVSK